MSHAIDRGVAEAPDHDGAFPRLGDEHLTRLRALGDVRAVSPGEVLFRAGDETCDFFVVESGEVAIVQGYGEEDRVIAVHGPRRFLGELNLLTGSRLYLTAVVREAGEVLQVPVARLREIVAQDEDLSNLILGAFLARRSLLIEAGTGVKLVGSRYSPDTRRLREFLARNRMPYQWIDLESDEEADTLLRALQVEPGETPVVIGTGGEVLRNPSNAQVASLLGLGARGAPPALCDLVIVGGGPAGLAAAVYGASEGLDTQAIDGIAFGGQASTSSRIENYLGFPAGISGSELAERAALQAIKFGARLAIPAQAVGLVRDDGHFQIQLAGGDVVNGRAVIVATGAQYNKLDVPDLERFEGLGVYYAATQAEAQLCAGDSVLIVGGGNSAGQAAMFLSRHAAECHLMIRGEDLGKSMSRYLIDEIERREQVEVMTCSEVVELRGEDALEAVVIRDTRTGELHERECEALFVFIGASPHTDWLGGQVKMDEHCFLLAGADLRDQDLDAYHGERPLFLETSQPGVFAVGDVRSGSIKRVASAVGEGSMAVALVHQRLAVR
ncbi:MAG TPA: FAD-dependent oxidoreductase [Solirubrobacteraceae bacterium]|jgi:thioredoxin reductase (NADPH)|nr:FAD-dependent oxidoreductase [Solirubrobacteraceae bacterium]